MSKAESLKEEIRKLSPEELAELRTWFLEYDTELGIGRSRRMRGRVGWIAWP